MRIIIVLTVNLLFSQDVANKNQFIADNHGLFESNLNENWFKEKRKKVKRIIDKEKERLELYGI